MTHDPLDKLLDAARQTPPEPAPQLVARIMQDASAQQERLARPADARALRGQREGRGASASASATASASAGLWQQFLAAVGGWPSVTSLAAATVAGVWIGISAPQGLAVPDIPVLNFSALEDTDDLGAWGPAGDGFDFTMFEG